MEKLISMTKFVLLALKQKQSASEFKEIVKKYAELLEQPLALGMFIPCKLVGGVLVVLEEPLKQNYVFEDHPELVGNPKEYDLELFEKEIKEYQEAKDRVLFEGKFQVRSEGNPFVRLNNIEFHLSGLTIERLVTFELELTKTSQKQLS